MAFTDNTQTEFVRNVHNKELFSIDFLRLSRIEYTYYTDCSFDLCTVEAVTFKNCKFIGCTFNNSSLHDIFFDSCTFNDCSLDKGALIDIVFSGCSLFKVNIKNQTNIDELKFQYCKIGNSSFTYREGLFGDIVFEESVLNHCLFSYFTLNNSVWDNSSVYSSSFEHCDFSEAIIDDVVMELVFFKFCKFINSEYSKTSLITCSYVTCSFDNDCAFDKVSFNDTLLDKYTTMPDHLAKAVNISPSIEERYIESEEEKTSHLPTDVSSKLKTNNGHKQIGVLPKATVESVRWEAFRFTTLEN